jgi:hypothetical protein
MANQQPGVGKQQEASSKSEGFGMTKVERTGETAGMVVAEQARAEIQARRFLALQFPRDNDDVRQKLLKECERPSFADAAIYEKPQGAKSIEGFSIRFAEAAVRCMGNLGITAYSIFDDRFKRIVRQSVEDFENNVVYSLDITLDKTVERHNAEGREVVGTRTNKRGEQVYIVAATEDELLNKERAQISKAIRTNGLRHVPGDILDEAKQLCYSTMEKRDKADPDAARNKLYDAFAMQFGIMPSTLKEYLGHENTPTPIELRELRGVFGLIRDGEMTWKEILEAKLDSRKATEGKESKGASTLKAKLAERDEKAKLADEKKAAEAKAAEGKAGAGGSGGAPEGSKDAPKGEAPKADTTKASSGKGGSKSAPEGQGSLLNDEPKKGREPGEDG